MLPQSIYRQQSRTNFIIMIILLGIMKIIYNFFVFCLSLCAADFLLQPCRKPKRIRTAFAPVQLLELEHAFEGNQYVVGSERKALAKNLNLTETQVNICSAKKLLPNRKKNKNKRRRKLIKNIKPRNKQINNKVKGL